MVRRWVPAAALLVAAGLLVIVPLLVLLRTALEEGLDTLVEAIVSAGPAIWASVWTSALATLLAVGVGAVIAVLTERTAVPGRRGLRLAMLLALVVPGYVAALGWLNAYGPGGLIDDLFGISAPALVGPTGIVAVMGVEAAPISGVRYYLEASIAGGVTCTSLCVITSSRAAPSRSGGTLLRPRARRP